MAALLAFAATLVPMILDFGSFFWVFGLPLSVVCCVISLACGLVGCAQERRVNVLGMSAPLAIAYILIRDRLQEPILTHAVSSGFLSVDYLRGTAGALSVSILVIAASMFGLLCVGFFRTRRTSLWTVGAGSLSLVIILWDVFSYRAAAASAGRPPYFVIPSFWLLVSGVGFAWIAACEMLRGEPRRSRLLGAVAVGAASLTVASALLAGFGVLGTWVFDGFHIEVLSRRLDGHWLAAFYIIVGVVVGIAGLRMRPFMTVVKN